MEGSDRAVSYLITDVPLSLNDTQKLHDTGILIMKSPSNQINSNILKVFEFVKKSRIMIYDIVVLSLSPVHPYQSFDRECNTTKMLFGDGSYMPISFIPWKSSLNRDIPRDYVGEILERWNKFKERVGNDRVFRTVSTNGVIGGKFYDVITALNDASVRYMKKIEVHSRSETTKDTEKMIQGALEKIKNEHGMNALRTISLVLKRDYNIYQ